jgi:hypothetical protein
LGCNRPRGFPIDHPKISFEIVLKELSALHIHEEIIPEKEQELVERITHDGIWIHPIIVDRKSLVVLDGMHRVAAAKEIGYRYIPACLVDYDNPDIRIGCWYRMFKNLIEAEEVKRALDELGLTPVKKPYDEAQRLVEGREAVTAVFSASWCLTAAGSASDIKERYDVIKQIEMCLQANGHHMGYSTDRDAPSRVASGEYSAGLMTPTVTKREVVETALAGMVFSQKTTRHIIPARPMFVNVPVGWLSGNLSVEEANTRLREHLASKKIELMPPGQILDRRYDEALYFFK